MQENMRNELLLEGSEQTRAKLPPDQPRHAIESSDLLYSRVADSKSQIQSQTTIFVSVRHSAIANFHFRLEIQGRRQCRSGPWFISDSNICKYT